VAGSAAAADAMDHHPDVDLRTRRVEVVHSRPDVDGVTGRDVRLARAISGLAAELGVAAAPEQVMTLEIALDTPTFEAVKPFWRALLGYADTSRPEEIRDPAGRWPTLWFQGAPRKEALHQRFHFDVYVPPEVAEVRIDNAIAAGGEILDDSRAPAYWVLADGDGNRACVCTWQEPAAEPA
jgi:4a-hydroxytetrahydrobiopterin dehydratase